MQSQPVARLAAALLILATLAVASPAAAELRSPEAFLGHPVGADYRLARWETIVDYFRHVAEHSDRVAVHELGETTGGLPMIWAEIASPATIRDVARHRDEQRRIADPRLIDGEDEAQRLVRTARVPVLINCSLHSTEVAASQMAMELLWELATGDSDEVREVLDRVVVLLVPSANPDGLNLVIDWYERSLGKPWEGRGMPWLYQRYAGHDNNRDWFMLNLVETRHLTRLIYDVWRPTIVWDVHQMGNSGARFFVPPFHDPKNPNVPALIEQGLLVVGGQMAQALTMAGKRGVIHGAIYDNWWAGGFRTTVYRHNMIGLLTEAASANVASPVFQRRDELEGGRRGMPDYSPTINFPDPWPGGWWRLRDVVDYELIAARALVTYAARYHDLLQRNFLELGRQAIVAGRTEPPHAWLVPPDQHDPGTAVRLVERLMATGIEVHRATAPFTADGVDYPAGTWVLYCAQPWRPHLMDMMERQVYPNRERYPGGPAEAPYDMAGWTLPLQMGVRAVAVRRSFEAEVQRLEDPPRPDGRLAGAAPAPHYVVLAGHNDDFTLLNRLYEAGARVRIYRGGAAWRVDAGGADGPGGAAERDVPPGSLVLDGADVRRLMPGMLDGLSTTPVGVGRIDDAAAPHLVEARRPRVGLYQPWTASMDEGWTRFVLDSFDVPYATVHDSEVRAGRLRERHDALVLPSVAPDRIVEGRAPGTTAPEYTGGIGVEGVVELQDFVQNGGTLVCIDRSCNLVIERFNVPVRNVVEGVDSETFFCPGSLLRVSVDPTHPVGWGMPEWVSASFARSQAFRLGGDDVSTAGGTGTPAGPAGQGVEAAAPARAQVAEVEPHRRASLRFPTDVVARYSDTVLLESGWIRGEELIRDRPAIVEVHYGRGRIVMLGFRVQHRGQPHGTFRLLFNAIQSSTLPGAAG